MDDLYDEFGNYIGAPEESDNEEEQAAYDGARYLDDDEDQEVTGQEVMDLDDQGPSNAVVLHEDKQYYPSARNLYGEDVEVLVQEEDTQRLEQPIVAPIEVKKFTVEEANLPPVYYSRDYLVDLLNFPEQVRNVVICGHLHHGKTSFVDMLVAETHDLTELLAKRTGRERDEPIRYTDTHLLERERGLSIKAAPISLPLQATNGKTHLVNIIDAPGHVNFADEVAMSMRLADGVVLVVDVVEGVQTSTGLAIKHAMLAGSTLR